mmetsp:Transcript_12563/g.28381  ORF Transcript_12563/g.28381 Transcript_12563/m.28381 type:complete len:969 (+) Transcript_12563:59-2965(+)
MPAFAETQASLASGHHGRSLQFDETQKSSTNQPAWQELVSMDGSLSSFNKGTKGLVDSLYGARWARSSRSFVKRPKSSTQLSAGEPQESSTAGSTANFRAYVSSYWPCHFNRHCVIMIPVGAGAAANQDPGSVTVSCDLRAFRAELEDKRAYLVAYDADKLRTIGRGQGLDARSASDGWIALECLCSKKVPLRHPVEEVTLALEPDLSQHNDAEFTAMLRIVLLPKSGKKMECKAIGDALTLKLRRQGSDDKASERRRRIHRPSRFVGQLTDEGLVGLLEALQSAAAERGLENSIQQAFRELCKHEEWWEHLPPNLADEALVSALKAFRKAAQERGLDDGSEDMSAQLANLWTHLPELLSDSSLAEALKLLQEAARARGMVPSEAELMQHPELLTDEQLQVLSQRVADAMKTRGISDEAIAPEVLLEAQRQAEEARREAERQAAAAAQQAVATEERRKLLEQETQDLVRQAREAALREAEARQEAEATREAVRREAEEVARKAEEAVREAEKRAQEARTEAERKAEDAKLDAEHRAAEAKAAAEEARRDAAEKEARIARAEEEAQRILAMEAALQEAERKVEEEAKRIAELEHKHHDDEEALRIAREDTEKQRLEAAQQVGAAKAAAEAALVEARKEAQDAMQKMHEEESKRRQAEEENHILKEKSKSSLGIQGTQDLSATGSGKLSVNEDPEGDAMSDSGSVITGKSNVGLDLGATRTKVKVVINSAMDLPAADLGGKSDPYVVCYVPDRPDCKFQTDVVKKSLQPTWDQQHTFDSVALEEPLEFEVWDHNVGRPHSLLVSGTLEPESFRPNGWEGELEMSRKRVMTLLGPRKEIHCRLAIGVEILPMPVTGPRLFVKVCSAHELKPNKLLRRRPQCTCWIPGKPFSRFKTPGKQKTLNPTWNIEAEVSDYQLGDPLEFLVESEGNPLGSVRVEHEQILEGIDGYLELTGEGSAGKSRVKVRIHVLQ